MSIQKKFKVSKGYNRVCSSLREVPFLTLVHARIATEGYSKSMSHYHYRRAPVEGWVAIEGYYFSKEENPTTIEIRADFKEQVKKIRGELEKKL